MKKKVCVVLAVSMVLASMLVGCGKGANDTISVLTREDGSGTRGAFIELFGIEQKNEAGEKVDKTIAAAEVTNSTSVMMTTIEGNKNAIGYVSLGSLNDTVKALKVDGAEATVENVKNGSYRVARPFNICTQEEVSEIAEDFITYIMSADGQAVIAEAGYVTVAEGEAYEAGGLSGEILVVGSSSVTPVMEKLAESYETVNPDVDVRITQNDSSTGVSSTIEGICDIGMASRDLKEAELAEGLVSTTIAMDGIAVIVNNGREAENITSEDVLKIYTGELTKWSELSE